MTAPRARPTLQEILDRAAIDDLLSAHARGLDDLDRGLILAVFAEEVLWDLSSWNRIPAAPTRMDGWFDEMAALMSGFDATQHLLVNREIRFDGERATSRCSMVATHHMTVDGERRVHAIGGVYEHAFAATAAGWRITALKLTIRWEQGDRGLFRLAANRAERRPIRRAPTD